MQQYRVMMLEQRNDSERTVEASLSSETPVFRLGLGNEILQHSPDAIDLSRCPLPLLTSHNDSETPVGIIENVRIVGGKLRGVLRFGGSTRARDVWEDVKAGVLRSISIGYQILDAKADGETYRVTRWMPYEASLVSVPADPNVGIGRSFKGKNTMENIEVIDQGEHLSRSQRRAASRSNAELIDAMKEINALVRQFDVAQDAVDDFLNRNGADVDRFRSFILSRVTPSESIRPEISPEIGLTDREASKFSFRNAILCQMDPKLQRHAGLELEVSRAVAQRLGRDSEGLFIPLELLNRSRGQRDLVVGTPSAGGYLRPTEHLGESFIDVLRNASHVMSLGAQELLGLRGDVTVPKKTESSSAYWVTEGESPDQSDMTLGQVALSPNTVAGFTSYSRKLMLQSSPDIETLIRLDLAAALAVEVDRATINGSGVGAEPLGVLNSAGVASVAIGTNGGALTWDHVLDLEQALAASNADAGSLAYLATTQVRRKLKGTLKVPSDAGAGFIWAAGSAPGEGSVNGYRALATNNVPSDLTKGTGIGLSAMIFGNWADVLIGHWGALQIIADPYSLSTSGTVRVTAMLDVDIALRRPASFAVVKDVVTS